jgi:hypothetical protein
MISPWSRRASPRCPYLGHHDPGFTLRTYVHLMPSTDDRMRKAVDAVFASSDGPETAQQGVR